MGVRSYSHHLTRINKDELPKIPPQADANSLRDDEMLDILLFGTPKSWQKEMDRQGFDPWIKGFDDTVAFMERIEDTEDKPESKPSPSKKESNGKKPSKSEWKKSNGNKAGADKYCLLHGKGNHNTDECHKLQSEAKRLKGNDGGFKPAGGNKTWTRKADENSKDSKKEFNAIIKKAVKQGVRKEINAIAKKRKSDDSSEEGEIKCMDFDYFDLKDFNYEEMDKMKLDDEVSI